MLNALDFIDLANHLWKYDFYWFFLEIHQHNYENNERKRTVLNQCPKKRFSAVKRITFAAKQKNFLVDYETPFFGSVI